MVRRRVRQVRERVDLFQAMNLRAGLFRRHVLPGDIASKLQAANGDRVVVGRVIRPSLRRQTLNAGERRRIPQGFVKLCENPYASHSLGMFDLCPRAPQTLQRAACSCDR